MLFIIFILSINDTRAEDGTTRMEQNHPTEGEAIPLHVLVFTSIHKAHPLQQGLEEISLLTESRARLSQANSACTCFHQLS